MPGRPRKSVTMNDVAREAGVSTSTVSLVLNNKGTVAEETRRQVQKIAERLGYVHQRRRGTDKSLLGLVVEALPHPVTNDAFLGRLIAGVERAACRYGYHVVLSLVDVEQEQLALPSFVESRDVDGMVVVGGGDLTDAYLNRLAESGIPMVLLDNYLYNKPVPSVTVDNLRAGFQLTSHLISLGHRRIGFVRGPRKYKPLLERLQGYHMALHGHGIEYDPALIPARRSRGAYKGYEEARELLGLADPPTAVIAVSDRTAVNVLRAITEEGLAVPGDIALASFDDTPEASEQVPPLTTMRIPKEAMGETAVRHLISIIEDPGATPVNIQLFSELVVRESCGARLQTGQTAVLAGS